MKIKLIAVGKTAGNYWMDAMAEYEKRLKYYAPVELIIIPALKLTKNFSEDEIRLKEGKSITEKIKDNNFVALLDKNGKELSSIQFADFIQKKLNQGLSNLTFVIGGAYGFDKMVYEQADFQLSLSAMTFPHQLARLVFIEQLYRAFTILKHEKYHH